MNRTFHVIKITVYRFDLPYIEGTGPCGPIKIIFGDHIYSQHTILNIKFGVNRMFHDLKTPEYRFDLYGR